MTQCICFIALLVCVRGGQDRLLGLGLRVLSQFRRKIGLVLSVTGVAATVLSGCGSSDAATQTGAANPVVTAIPSGTADSRTLAAVHTYEAFNRTVAVARRSPVPARTKLPYEADFTRYSFDPARAEYEAVIADLSNKKWRYRGKQPKSDIRVTSINPEAAEGPTVTLSDCLRTVKPGWVVYNAVNNTPVKDKTVTTPAVQALAITVVFTRLRWGVQTITPDTKRKCAP
jgi:hypothetical protein